jgi:hypothetical protein
MRRLLLAAPVVAYPDTAGAMVGHSFIAPAYADQTGDGGGGGGN